MGKNARLAVGIEEGIAGPSLIQCGKKIIGLRAGSHLPYPTAYNVAYQLRLSVS